MKLLLVAAIIFFATVSAQAWTVNPYIQVNPSFVQATVSNNARRPIVCRGYVYARTRRGFQGHTYMNNVLIYPGNYAYVYVNTNNAYFDPIVNGWGNINCFWY